MPFLHMESQTNWICARLDQIGAKLIITGLIILMELTNCDSLMIREDKIEETPILSLQKKKNATTSF